MAISMRGAHAQRPPSCAWHFCNVRASLKVDWSTVGDLIVELGKRDRVARLAGWLICRDAAARFGSIEMMKVAVVMFKSAAIARPTYAAPEKVSAPPKSWKSQDPAVRRRVGRVENALPSARASCIVQATKLICHT